MDQERSKEIYSKIWSIRRIGVLLLTLTSILLRLVTLRQNKYPPAKPGVFHMRAWPSVLRHISTVQARSVNCIKTALMSPHGCRRTLETARPASGFPGVKRKYPGSRRIHSRISPMRYCFTGTQRWGTLLFTLHYFAHRMPERPSCGDPIRHLSCR